ncbi:MAG: type B DNA-directed DNA polymerase [Methanomicrobiaceae archaeon]|nr:type B DNA-directed DNA polymerase [Methanomicrobiaceae archaeon]
MWVLDAVPVRGGVNLWGREGGRTERLFVEVPPSFYLDLPDPAAHWEMLEVLEGRHGAVPCTFATVYGERAGYEVHAGRKVAEAVEQQTRFAAELFNVDVRAEQRHFAATGRFPCSYPGECRFCPDFPIPLTTLEILVGGHPFRDAALSPAEVRCGEEVARLSGTDHQIAEDLAGLVAAFDPDVVLFPLADHWMHRILALNAGAEKAFSRSGRVRSLGARSYWSYGRREYRPAAIIPEGRILIDTEQSFVYREGGLPGVLLTARLTGLSPNLTSRFTPGTLVSAYEVYEALRRGIAIPFRKRDPERCRTSTELRSADRGGMMFQPAPGVHGRTFQIDFTSLYPAIIVKYNLSPETMGDPEKRGFLAEALAPLLAFRVETKRQKRAEPRYAGIDSVLKWMLVTCFGYTGYRNAKFGRIEVHEQITGISREILLASKDLAEQMGCRVLHGIVDCLWVQGEDIRTLKARIEEETGIGTECEVYDWLVFLPQSDGSGAYNRYYGRLSDSTVKVRGIAARRRDSPEYVARMQHDLLAVMGEARTLEELAATEGRARAIYLRFRVDLPRAPTPELAITRQISRLSYRRDCLEAAAVRAFRQRGADPVPGMKVGYVVRDAAHRLVDPEWDAGPPDLRYYAALLDRAWEEIAFPFRAFREQGGTESPK